MRSPKERPRATEADSGGLAIVTIKGKAFVTGLFWQPLSSPRNYMAEARTMATAHRWDLVAIRKGRRIQAGFGSREAGASKGMYSLAASLAQILGDTWAGAFEVAGGGIYVCALKDGLVVPGFDALFASSAEAADKLEEAILVVAPDDRHRYAPASFTSGYQPAELEALLDPRRLRGDCQVRQLRLGVSRQEWIGIGLVASLCVAVIVGVHELQAHKQRKLVAERMRLAQEERARLSAQTPQPVTPATPPAALPPWAAMPSAADFSEACGRTTGTVPLSVGGWLLEAATCDRQGVSIAYRRPRDGATASQFVAGASGQFAGEPAFADEGNLALVGRPLNVPFAGNEALPRVEVQLVDLVSYFQRLGVTPTVSEVKAVVTQAPTAPPEPAQAAASESAASWRKFTLAYETSSSPASHFAALRTKAGLRLTEIKLTLKAEDASLVWNVKGEIYAAR